MKSNKGFTLIELLVVFAIISLLIGLTAGGLIQFRAITELKESGRQVILLFDVLRNSAKNDVRDAKCGVGANVTCSLDYKGYKFNFDSKKVFGCLDQYPDFGSGPVVSYGSWNCSESESLNDIATIFEGAQGSELGFNIGEGRTADSVNEAVPQCQAVFFEALTGDIYIEDVLTQEVATEKKCYIPFSDNGKVYTNFLFINGLTDTYDILLTADDVLLEYNR